MALVVEGRIGLDDPVGPFLRRWQFPTTAPFTGLVTLRGLLSHTAGLPSASSAVYREPNDVPSLVDVVSGRAGSPAAVPGRWPGEAFRYSNPGYGLVQLLVEDISEMPFSDWANTRVLQPLEMTSSGFVAPAAADANRAAPHRRSGSRMPDGFFNQQAAGGLVTTVDDLGRLCTAMIATGTAGRDGGVLPASAIEEMWICPPAGVGAFRLRNGGYGLGQVSGALPSGTPFIANQGSRPGWRSLLICLPDRRCAVAIATNANSGLPLLVHLGGRWLRRAAGERLPGVRLSLSRHAERRPGAGCPRVAVPNFTAAAGSPYTETPEWRDRWPIVQARSRRPI